MTLSFKVEDITNKQDIITINKLLKYGLDPSNVFCLRQLKTATKERLSIKKAIRAYPKKRTVVFGSEAFVLPKYLI